MFNGFCDSGTWGFLGDFGAWGWAGVIITLIFWVGLIFALTLVVLWALRRAQFPAGAVSYATGQTSPKESLQVQYAKGEITRQQYERRKLELDKPKG